MYYLLFCENNENVEKP
jgi:hypothetical protein